MYGMIVPVESYVSVTLFVRVAAPLCCCCSYPETP